MDTEHVAMTAATVEKLRAQCTRDAEPRTWARPTVGTLFGIPVVVDDSLPAEPGWELRQQRPAPDADEVQSYIDWAVNLMGRTHD